MGGAGKKCNFGEMAGCGCLKTRLQGPRMQVKAGEWPKGLAPFRLMKRCLVPLRRFNLLSHSG